MSRLVVLVSVFALAFAIPANAERWQDRVDNDRVKTRLDLDGFRRDGRLLTYRMEITVKGTPDHPGTRTVSTSVIDCRTNMRKNLATETFLPDGSVQKKHGANRWMTLKDWEFAVGVRNDYCGAAD